MENNKKIRDAISLNSNMKISSIKNEENAIKRQNFQKDFVAKRKQDGDKYIEFLDGRKLLDDHDPGEYAVDGCHLTDAGFIKMSNGLQKVIITMTS